MFFPKIIQKHFFGDFRKVSIEFVLTDNEGEAYLLESNMIKRYRPTYNIELKDQQRYTYLRLTDEKYPRLLVARRIRTGKFLGKGKVFCPFTSGSSKLLTIGTLRKAFKIRICKTLPKKVWEEFEFFYRFYFWKRDEFKRYKKFFFTVMDTWHQSICCPLIIFLKEYNSLCSLWIIKWTGINLSTPDLYLL